MKLKKYAKTTLCLALSTAMLLTNMEASASALEYPSQAKIVAEEQTTQAETEESTTKESETKEPKTAESTAVSDENEETQTQEPSAKADLSETFPTKEDAVTQTQEPPKEEAESEAETATETQAEEAEHKTAGTDTDTGNIAQGEYTEDGNNVTWVIDADGKLTIEGTGDFAKVEYDLENTRKIPWSNYVQDIKTAVVNVTGMKNAESMFDSCVNLTSIDFRNFDTSSVTNMRYMFYQCTSLTSVDVSGFDTGNVTNMSTMFQECENLTSVDVSGFNTSKVTNMIDMFYECKSLTSVDVSGFDTSKVTKIAGMFSGCESLTSVDVSGFDTSSVLRIDGMFAGCMNLTSVDVSGFNTSKVTDISAMFMGCENLTSLDLSGFDTSKVTDMMGMFAGCSSLTSLDLSGFDTSKVTDMFSMFAECSNLTSLDLSGFDTSSVTNMESMFMGCENLTSLDLSGFDTSSVTNMESMFMGCENLTSLDLSGFDTSKVTNMFSMFWDCNSLISVDVSGFDTSNVTYMEDMFYECNSLTNLDVSGFDTSKVTTMRNMFTGCESLTSLDISNFDTSKVTLMAGMFYGCISLTNIDVSNFDTSNVKDMYGMFKECSSLISLDLSSFDMGSKVIAYALDMFTGCDALTKIYTPRNVKSSSDILLTGTWYDAQGNEYTKLPLGLTDSILICKDNPPQISEKYITAKKTKTAYMLGEQINTNDITVTFYGEDGTAKILAQTQYETNASELQTDTAGEKTLTVTMTENEETLTADIRLTVGCQLDARRVRVTLPDADTYDYAFDGTEKKPTPAVSVNVGGASVALVENTDYTVSYRNNTHARTTDAENAPAVIITGCGNYWGSVAKAFAIQKAQAPEPVEIVKEYGYSTRTSSVAIDLSACFAQYGSVAQYTKGMPIEDDTIVGNVLTDGFAVSEDGSFTCDIQGAVGDFVTIPVTVSFADYEDSTIHIKLAIREKTAEEKKLVTISGIAINDSVYNKKPVVYSGTLKAEADGIDLTNTVNLTTAYSGTQADGNAYASTDTAPVNAGTYRLTIAVDESETDYTGSATYDFTIAKAPLAVTARDMQLEIGAQLPSGADYQYDTAGLMEGDSLLVAPAVTCPDADTSKAGTYAILVSGADAGMNYEVAYQNGTLTVSEKGDQPNADGIDLSKTDYTISKIRAKVYDQNAYEPVIKLTVVENKKKITLTEGADYLVSYQNNTSAGTGTITLKGIGEYKGELTKEFEISQKPVKKLKIITGSVTGDITALETEQLPIYVYDGARLLQEKTDYTLSTPKLVKAGAEVTVAGAGNYNGTAIAKITVYQEDETIIKPHNVSLKDLQGNEAPYTGKAVTPEVTVEVNGKLLTNREYKVQYQNNKNAGTAFAIVTGKGEYKGKAVIKFTIKADTVEKKEDIIIKPIPDKIYNRKLQKPAPTVSIQKGDKIKRLMRYKDYTVSYSNNFHKGEATVTVTGKGNYEGLEATATFTIKPQQMKKASLKGTKDHLTLTYSNRKLKEGTDYETPVYGTPVKNKVEVTIKGKGDFEGTMTKKVKVD